MIVVKIELHSAVTHRVTTLGQINIANDGTGNGTHGNYDVRLIDKNGRVFKRGRVLRFPRVTRSIWTLLRLALAAPDA